MSKQKIFLIHGMGDFLDENGKPGNDWHSEWIESIEEQSKKLKVFKTKKLKDRVKFVPINYDQYFEQYWEKSPLNGKFGNDLGLASMKTKVHGADIAELANSYNANSTADEKFFFWSHVADVILWRFGGDMMGWIANEVALQLMNEIDAADPPPIIVAHSLGTAVIHGALTALQKQGFNASGNSVPSVLLYSSVARILSQKYARVYKKPCNAKNGSLMRNLRHIYNVFDPFTWFKRYDADKAEGKNIPINHIGKDINLEDVHSFLTYMQAPKASAQIFRYVSGLDIFDIKDEVAELQEYFEENARYSKDNLDISDWENITEKQFWNFISDLIKLKEYPGQ